MGIQCPEQINIMTGYLNKCTKVMKEKVKEPIFSLDLPYLGDELRKLQTAKDESHDVLPETTTSLFDNAITSVYSDAGTEQKTRVEKFEHKIKEYDQRIARETKKLKKIGYDPADKKKLENLKSTHKTLTEKIQLKKTDMWETYSNLPVSEGVEACREILEAFGTEEESYYVESSRGTK